MCIKQLQEGTWEYSVWIWILAHNRALAYYFIYRMKQAMAIQGSNAMQSFQFIFCIYEILFDENNPNSKAPSLFARILLQNSPIGLLDD